MTPSDHPPRLSTRAREIQPFYAVEVYRQGGARPEAADASGTSGDWAGSVSVTPSSISQKRARTAGSTAASAEDPTMQVVQCVVDLR